MNESMIIATFIGTSKERDVVILVVPGVFLHVLTRDEVITLIRGPLVETMVEIDPELYHPQVTHGKKLSFAQI